MSLYEMKKFTIPSAKYEVAFLIMLMIVYISEKNHRSLFLIGVYKLAKSDKAYCFHDHCTNKFSCSPSFFFICRFATDLRS